MTEIIGLEVHMKNFFPLLFLILFSNNIFADESKKYQEFEEVDQMTEEMKQEIQEWTERADNLVIKIDSLIEKYRNLKTAAKEEVILYKDDINQSIQKEIQFRDISNTACEKGNTKECENADFHQLRIDDFTQKLKILNDMEKHLGEVK